MYNNSISIAGHIAILSAQVQASAAFSAAQIGNVPNGCKPVSYSAVTSIRTKNGIYGTINIDTDGNIFMYRSSVVQSGDEFSFCLSYICC